MSVVSMFGVKKKGFGWFLLVMGIYMIANRKCCVISRAEVLYTHKKVGPTGQNDTIAGVCANVSRFFNLAI